MFRFAGLLVAILLTMLACDRPPGLRSSGPFGAGTRTDNIGELRVFEIESPYGRGVDESAAVPGPNPQFCAVPGSTFANTWFGPRAGGRKHRGVDMFAPEGTPVVAPVAGRVLHGENPLGGLVFRLWGDDETFYYGSHLATLGRSGWVEAGATIGTVGKTGNASTTPPHLHLQIQPGFGEAVDPTPIMAAICASG